MSLVEVTMAFSLFALVTMSSYFSIMRAVQHGDESFDDYLALVASRDLLSEMQETANRRFFESLFSRSRETRVRLAAVGALGRLGKTSKEFLVRQLENSGNDVSVRRAAIFALAEARCDDAAPALIDALTDERLGSAAHRALRRLAERDVGRSKARWRRWWRSQHPVSPSDERESI
jgi:HEAT repeat protein